MIKDKKKYLCDDCKLNKYKYILNYTNYYSNYLCKFCLKNKLKVIEQIQGETLISNFYKINN